MNEEFTDAQISELLNTYGDAIESQVVQGNDHRAQDLETANTTNQGGTWLKGNDMANTEMADSEMAATAANEELPLLDAGVSSLTPEKAGRGRALVGALAITAVALVGGAFVLNAAFSDDGTTETASEVEESDAEADVEADPATTQNDPAVSSESSSGTSEPALDFGFGGESSVVFADGEFVSIGSGPDGLIVARSVDGLDWTTERAVGLPEGSFPEGLVRTNAGWATVVALANVEGESPFGPEAVPERLLGTSTDLVNWTTVELPSVDFSFVMGIAASGDTVSILTQVETGGVDELELLLNAGLITDEDVENYCSSNFSEGEAFVGYTCDFADDGDGETEVVRIEPEDPLYAEISELYAFDDDFVPPGTVVLSGPVSGPFEAVELPVEGFVGSIVGSDDGFAIGVSNFGQGDSSLLFSADGVEWVPSNSPVDGADAISSLAENNGTLAAVGQIFTVERGGTSVPIFSSADSGVTWTETSIPTELFDGFGQIISGPAGFVVSLDGSVEPTDGLSPFPNDLVVELQNDGYTMLMPLDIGDIELIGPDGLSVYGPLSQDVFFDEGPDAPIRFEGPNDETLIWLDPETGEDLVSFEESDFEAALEIAAPRFGDDVMDITDQERAVEVWFSVDGQSWTLLDSYESSFDRSAFTAVAGVGDDEVLIRSESFGEPPEELFAFESEGREPTAAEEAALDEWFMNRTDAVTWDAIPIG